MVDGANSRMIYFIYCKNFCDCHNVPPPSTTTKSAFRSEGNEFVHTGAVA
jgi:hypothetical protein